MIKARIYKSSLPDDPTPWRYSVHDDEREREYKHGHMRTWKEALDIAVHQVEDLRFHYLSLEEFRQS